jgi:cytochrome c biogenesis protein CcdA
MASGMIGAFVGAGMLLAQTGTVLGIERTTVTQLAAVIFVLTGAVLVIPKLHSSFNRIMLPVSELSSRLGAKAESLGAFGYVLAGALLGLIWAPCSGPTLGVAFTLAAKDESLMRAATLMSLFGLGSSIPILGVAYGAKNIFISKRRVLIKRGVGAKNLLGSMMILLGVLALTGTDKIVEEVILAHLPEWWLDLSTKL